MAAAPAGLLSDVAGDDQMCRNDLNIVAQLEASARMGEVDGSANSGKHDSSGSAEEPQTPIFGEDGVDFVAPTFPTLGEFSEVAPARSTEVPKLSLPPSPPQHQELQHDERGRQQHRSQVVSLGEPSKDERHDWPDGNALGFSGHSPRRSASPQGFGFRCHTLDGSGPWGGSSSPERSGSCSPRLGGGIGLHKGAPHRNAKLDLSKALPAAELAIATLQKLVQQLGEERSASGGDGPIGPRNAIEAALRAEMAKVLEVEESMICCRTSDFFLLGGSPDSAGRLVLALQHRQELLGPEGRGPHLTLEDLKKAPTVFRLAKIIGIRSLSSNGDSNKPRSRYDSHQSHQSHFTDWSFKAETLREKVAQNFDSAGFGASGTGRLAAGHVGGMAQGSAQDSLAVVIHPVGKAASNEPESPVGSRQCSKSKPIECLPESRKEETATLPPPRSFAARVSHTSHQTNNTETTMTTTTRIGTGSMSQPLSSIRLAASGRFRVTEDQDEKDMRRLRVSTRVPISAMLFGSLRHIHSMNSNVVLAFVESGFFQVLSGAAIIASAVCIGVETEFRSLSKDADAFETMNIAFDAVFLAELVLRILAYGRAFFSNADYRWNLLDTFCVLVGICGDAIILLNVEIAQVQTLKGLRLLRLVRTLRIVRTMKSVREFQKMLYAVMSSIRTLLCSLMILFGVMYFFGIVLCHGVTQYKLGEAESQTDLKELDEYFGSLSKTFLSLLMSITSGFSWNMAYGPLAEVGPVYGMLFLAYLTTCLFGVMNVVTSVFVESAIMSAQHYKHLIIQEKAREREIAVGHMKQVFKQIDEDSSGEITADEMDEFLQDPGLRKYIEALDINAENARMLFRLLDRDDSSKVDIEEFCEGCLRLQGDAKSFDVHAMMYQMKSFLSKWSEFTLFVECCFADLAEAQGRPDLFAKAFMIQTSSQKTPHTSNFHKSLSGSSSEFSAIRFGLR